MTHFDANVIAAAVTIIALCKVIGLFTGRGN